MTLHFLNDVAYDAELKQKIDNYVKIASLKSEPMFNRILINRIPGLRLLISSLPGSASRTHVKLLSLAIPQEFSKTCLVNLISKDTHQVISIYLHMPHRLSLIYLPHHQVSLVWGVFLPLCLSKFLWLKVFLLEDYQQTTALQDEVRQPEKVYCVKYQAVLLIHCGYGQTLFFFCSQMICGYSGLKFTKCLSKSKQGRP